MDFIHDTQAGGGAIRVLAVLDVFNRECVALEARQSFRGGDVATVLGQVGRERGLPEVIQCDQGTEFTSKALDHWAYWNQVKLDFSRPGKPTPVGTVAGRLQQRQTPQQFGRFTTCPLRGRWPLHPRSREAKKLTLRVDSLGGRLQRLQN
jgi:transposase InsO family protein